MIGVQFLRDEQVEENKWQQLLNKSAFASPFQTPEFYKVNKSSVGTDCHVFAVQHHDDYLALVVVVVQKEKGLVAFFSRRGIIFGGPLAHACSDILFNDFLDRVSTYFKHKVIYLETRNYFDFSSYKNSFEGRGWNYEPYVNVQMNLKGKTSAELISTFTSNRRNEIKKSISLGTYYGISSSEKEVEEIYKILHKLYISKVKLPIPSVSYFLKLFRSGIMKAFFVKHDGNIIGGAFCMVLAEKVIYTYYYCGLSYYKKNIYPTHLAILASLEFAINNSIPRFDFMGAGKLDQEYGVRQYKLQFGGDLVEHGRYLKILNSPLYIIGKKGLGLWKLLLPNK